MKVQAMLDSKWSKVATTRPYATIATAIRLLKLERIGALVVSDDGETLGGIISERDIVRGLVDHGHELLEMQVSELMTRAVKTCTPEANIKDVMTKMTRSRVRHLPVLDGGKLCAEWFEDATDDPLLVDIYVIKTTSPEGHEFELRVRRTRLMMLTHAQATLADQFNKRRSVKLYGTTA